MSPNPDEAILDPADEVARDSERIQQELSRLGINDLGTLVLKAQVADIVGFARVVIILPLDILVKALADESALTPEAISLGVRQAVLRLWPHGPTLALGESLLTLGRSVRTYQSPLSATDPIVHAVQVMRAVGHRRGLARALLDLGVNLKDLVLLYEALQAIELAEQAFSELCDNGGQAAALYHRATICRRNHLCHEALELLDRALALLPRTGSQELWIRQMWLERIQNLVDLDHRTEARSAIQAWVDEARQDPAANQGYLSIPLALLGTLHRRDGNTAAALEAYSRAVPSAARDILRHHTQRFRTGERATLNFIFDDAAECAADAGDAALCFGFLELARTGAISLATAADEPAAESDNASAGEIERLVEEAVGAASSRQPLEAVNSAAEWLIDRRHFLHAAAKQVPDEGEVGHLAASLRSELPQDTLLLQYAWIRDRLYVLALKRGETQLFATGLDHFETDMLMWSFKEEFRNLLPSDALTTLGAALLDPVRDLLDTATKVIVVPAEWLHGLPFHALLHNGVPLAKSHLIRYAASSRVIRTAERGGRVSNASTCAALGAAEVPYSQAPKLEKVASELSVLRHVFRPNGRVHKDATAADVLKGERSAVMHIACHAQLEAGTPLVSRLLMHDRPLFAFEIAVSKCDAELVFLSACDTAGETSYLGGRAESLASAFLAAGARSVVAALWPLDDYVAEVFVKHFYQELVSGGNGAAALKSTQQYVRSLAAYAHPYFWAPFALYGSG